MVRTKKKRKNPGVGVDFKRVKSKVGRKLKKVNETNTDFKTKSINLPNQNIISKYDDGGADGEEDIVLTKRMVSMEALIRQSRHYNQKVRVNALQGVLELLQQYDVSKTGQSLSQVIQCVLEALVDSCNKVRKVVLQVLTTLFTQRTGQASDHEGKLKPFVPLFLVHIFKAMTHLSHEVSTDGIEALSVMLMHLGRALSEQDDEFFRRLMENFNAILTQLFAEASNVESRSKFVMKLVACIEMSLNMFRVPERHGGSRSFESLELKDSWQRVFRRKFPQEYQDLLQAAGGSGSSEAGQVHRQEVNLFVNLRRLMNIFRIHFNDHKEVETDRRVKDYFDIACRVTSCLFFLLDTYEDFDSTQIREVMRDTARQFPVNGDDQSSVSKKEEDFLAYNINCTNLLLSCVSHLGKASEDEEAKNCEEGQPSLQGVIESTWGFTSRVLEESSLSRESCEPDKAEGRLHSLAASSIKMLKWVEPDTRALFIGNLCKILEGSKDFDVKRVILQTAFEEEDYILKHCSDEDRLKWLNVIPKIIWEAFKESDNRTCGLGSKVLLRLLQCAKPLGSKEKESLQLQLVPIFAVPMERGTFWGPFVSLGWAFQLDLSSVLHYLAPLSEKVVKSLTLCVLNPALSENICTKLLYSVTGGAAEESAHARISVLSSLILQSCRKRSDRAETVTLYACMCLKTSFSSPCAALLSLGDSVIAGLKDANVHLLGALITVFGEVVSEVDLTAETAQSLKDLISAPLAFVLLKWGIGDVKGEGSSKRSTQLESVWATARKAEFLVPSLITVLSEFVTKGSLRLKNELQVLESDDNALSSCAVSTVLYEMVKENLLSRNGKAELKSCLDNIGRHSSNMDTTFSKFVYLKESFL